MEGLGFDLPDDRGTENCGSASAEAAVWFITLVYGYDPLCSAPLVSMVRSRSSVHCSMKAPAWVLDIYLKSMSVV